MKITKTIIAVILCMVTVLTLASCDLLPDELKAMLGIGEGTEPEAICEHTETTEVIDKKASCSEIGAMHYVCAACGEAVGEPEELDRLEHIPGDVIVDTAPTCKDAGAYHKTCTVCGETTEVGVLDATGVHTPGEAITDTEPTCKLEGSYHKECEVCGETVEAGSLDKLTTHTPSGWVVSVEPTCKDTGVNYQYCSVCGALVDAATTETVDHIFVDDYCKWCNVEYVSDGITYVSNGDGTCYVAGIGSCKYNKIVFPTTSPEGDIIVAIGDSAFEGTAITCVELPSTVKTIGERAFYGCASLTEIQLDNVTRVKKNAFTECASLVSTVRGIQYIDGWIVGFNASGSSSSSAFQAGTVGVADYALQGWGNPMSDAFPNSIRYIGEGAFYQSTGIRRAYFNQIDSQLEHIGSNAFYGCTAIYSVYLPHSLTSVGVSIFEGCTAITDVTLGTGLTTVTDAMFKNCTKLMRIHIPEGVKRLDGQAFYAAGSDSSLNYRIQAITIPASVTYIGNAFENAKILGNVYFAEGSQLETLAAKAFTNGPGTMFLPASVKNVDLTAFSSYISYICYEGAAEDWALVNVTGKAPNTYYKVSFYDEEKPEIEGSFWHYESGAISIWPAMTESKYFEYREENGGLIITRVGMYAPIELYIPAYINGKPVVGLEDNLFGSDNYTLIYIPSTLTHIGTHALRYLDSLKTIVISEKNTSYKTVGGALYDYDVTTLIYVPVNLQSETLEIPEGVTEILTYSICCGSDSKLTTLIIPSTLVTIPSSSIYANNLTTIEVAAGNPQYKAVDSVLYTADNILLLYPRSRAGEEFYVPEGTVEIAKEAFAQNMNLKICHIPASVEKIGIDAFYYSKLTEVNFARENSALTVIESGAFQSTSLTMALIPEGVLTIGTHAFSNIRTLKYVEIPASLTFIGTNAFKDASAYLQAFFADGYNWYQVPNGKDPSVGILMNAFVTDYYQDGKYAGDILADYQYYHHYYIKILPDAAE